MRADHGRSTVAPISRALASPRTPQPRYHAKGLAEMRQRMSRLLMDSKNCSRKVLPKGEQRVSKEFVVATHGCINEIIIDLPDHQKPRTPKHQNPILSCFSYL